MTDEPMPFGDYLRRLRKAKRMTLQELGDSVGHSKGYMSNIEKGRHETLSLELFRKLSTALGVSYIGMLIKAGHLTEDEVLEYRIKHGVFDKKAGDN